MATPQRTKAEEKFAAIEQRNKAALKEQAVLVEKRRENTARLRELRLAKEAEDAKVAAEAKALKAAAPKRKRVKPAEPA